MTDATASQIDSADGRRFALTVWPQTAGRAWQARISGTDAAQPLCFDRPVDLVLYLTELSDGADGRPLGLR
ncbi:MAG: hypothetical protein ABIQ06_05725 [Caldimonas sp.]